MALAVRQDGLDNLHLEPPLPCIRPMDNFPPLQSEPIPVICSMSRQASEATLEGLSHQCVSRQANGIQRLDEPSATQRGPSLPELCESVRRQEPPVPAVPVPVERPQIANASTPPVIVVQEPSRGSAPTQSRNSIEYYPAKAGNEDEDSQGEGSARSSFPEISWGGWRLVRTPDGIYLPETFNPFPHELEDLTDQWGMTEKHATLNLARFPWPGTESRGNPTGQPASQNPYPEL